jgi:sirohydrochlorin cobaltochelatase
LKIAYLLVTHGSNDPRPAIAVANLAESIADALAATVGTATLELATTSLARQIETFAKNVAAEGVRKVLLLPLFLQLGVHVSEDLPAEVAAARQALADDREFPDIEIELLPDLGGAPSLTAMLRDRRQHLPPNAIVLAHGSRRSGGNDRIEAIATELNLSPAYWSISPKLTQAVVPFLQCDVKEIGVLLYFLFPGGITDAITATIAEIQTEYPSVKILVSPPIGNDELFAKTIVDLLQSSTDGK